jgi:hypothetical protein
MMTQNPHQIAETWEMVQCVGTRGKHSAEWWNDEFEALNSHVKAGELGFMSTEFYKILLEAPLNSDTCERGYMVVVAASV